DPSLFTSSAKREGSVNHAIAIQITYLALQISSTICLCILSNKISCETSSYSINVPSLINTPHDSYSSLTGYISVHNSSIYLECVFSRSEERRVGKEWM